METTPKISLRRSDVSNPDSVWARIADFALTFHGYEWAGNFDKLSTLANSTRQAFKKSPEHKLPTLKLDELRACLFFEHRRHVHFGSPPDGQDLLYIQALVKCIREGLAN